ncbi:oxidoreductase, aldo/keto reductase family protein [Cooperia oncophora]
MHSSCYPLDTHHGAVSSIDRSRSVAVKAAIEAGYRLIDTAACYQNEEAIGETLKDLIHAGKVTREELFITTKLWVSHLHPEDVESALRESLRKLQVEYVDLYLAHAPTAYDKNMKKQDHSVKVQDTWHGLEEVYKKGLTKAIGVSNYSGEQIERVLQTATVPIHNCQVELHLYWPQHELHELCKRHDICLTSYATLGSPGRVKMKALATGQPVTWPANKRDLDDPNVKAIAAKYSKTPAQILLRYVIDPEYCGNTEICNSISNR